MSASNSNSNSNSPERGEDGCVICTETAECPVCAEDEYCMMTAMTCDRCPTTYCAKKSVTASLAVLNNLTDITSANLSATNQHPEGQISNGNTQKTTDGSVNSNGHKGSSGGTVGGVIAGLVIGFAVIGFITYKWYWRRRKLRRMDRELEESLKEEGDISGDSSGTFDGTNGPMFESSDTNEYNDGVRHNNIHGYGNNPGLLEQYNDIKNLQASFMQPNLTNLNTNGFSGTADTASVHSSGTDASSLLPIAYIPGVTSGGPPRSRSTPTVGTSLYGLTIPGNVASHITLGSSVLGNIDEEDEDSVLQPPDMTTMNTVYRPSPQFSAESRFTTAMRAKPKLVQINNMGSTESILKEAGSTNHL